MKVKFLKVEDIEAATLCLLAEYGRKFGVVARPPVPVEEILESHLNLHLGFDDLPKMLNASDVLGATWVHDQRVLIDQSLDPSVHAAKEGRYRFTVAHEIGHWELHRHHFMDNPGQGSLFGSTSKPSIVCRTSSRKEPIEWQADAFSGYLLMPKEMVVSAWKERKGSLDFYVAKKEIAGLSARWGLAEDELPAVDIARELARDFKVSGQAMQIRLIGLGLIKTEDPGPCLFSR
jgi:hypothetical protein